MQNITILGSTGSIGTSTLQVVSLHPEKFSVFALTAHKNTSKLFEQCLRYKPSYAVMSDEKSAEILAKQLKSQGLKTEVLSKEEDLQAVAAHPQVDTVMACIVGAAGLSSTLAAAQSGKRILLANKEALVMSGELLLQAVHENNALLLPVDSEHNAIFQCLPPNAKLGYRCESVKQIILTASGGAFRDWPLEQLTTATPAQACKHPNWTMGAKITVDSATMMNKGLEVIEASYLFRMPIDAISVILHPQSIIHSLVEYQDGSTLAQLGEPDMRVPISYVLNWPERIASGVKSLDLLAVKCLEFQPLCLTRYPCLDLAYQAFKVGGTAPTILNAANEVAVQLFLDEKICFTDIPKLISYVLERTTHKSAKNLDIIFEADVIAREKSFKWLDKNRKYAAFN
ncbi:MAG: dxr [Gammaproteobacteria bacterium]|jgi:1-deoxy-D-xylulose-5-phosphate reductoisomerase|nr:dxr [Gammaproteobacteria bacterium]